MLCAYNKQNVYKCQALIKQNEVKNHKILIFLNKMFLKM
ncbi:hypothetical protein EJK53_1646 [Moraxella catarrhalis]|uniref:Uncharacterized protein n=1 Tax=Moraxella catarrhalis TaxID=480 RepID=A0A3Q9GEC9_MORCA|nr:hypothetical protein EJK53_1572 [Moraxella catarrhalis]AZQ93523.1 hypothetical protein EJK53_1646 [Moraxella catarrhalis]